MKSGEHFDVIIIGAGPSGIFCAYELIKEKPELNILMIEKGRPIEKRVCPKRTTKVCVGCKPCSITTGFAGAGAFSDGKLSLSPADHAFLKSLGVDDSKNLNDIKIRQIAPILEEKIPHKALLLSPRKYNEVVGDGKSHNAVSVKVALHNQAIFLLLQSGAKPDKIVIDAFTSEKNYQKYLKNERNRFDFPITLEEKAEGKYLAVAVSSIIARNLFLENLDKLSQEVGYTLPSGAGAKSDQVAAKLLQAYGDQALQATAKYHFANTKKAYQRLK